MRHAKRLLVCCFLSCVFFLVVGCNSEEPNTQGKETKKSSSEENPISAGQTGLNDPASNAVKKEGVQSERALSCAIANSSAAESTFRIAKPKSSPSSKKSSQRALESLNVDALIQEVYTECSSCHAPRVAVGGVRFVGAYGSEEMSIKGETVLVPGFHSMAESIAKTLKEGTMPPNASTRPEHFAALGRRVQAWIDAGKPASGDGSLSDALPAIWGASDANAFTALGDCIPQKNNIKKLEEKSFEKDSFFAVMQKLPNNLSETDLETLDTQKLAALNVFAYDVQYPLWNDFAKKLRHVRIPHSSKDSERLMVELHKDPALRDHKYSIPDNSRFYKTFFSQKRNAEGEVVYRPMETRVIVVRKNADPLFGTYVWKDDYSDATLLVRPYRDGTAWKDLVIDDEFDALASSENGDPVSRKYVVPAKHRCVQCHQGTEDNSFVLGFNPYQLNIRDTDPLKGQLSRDAEWMNQNERLHDFGVLAKEASEFKPKLEKLPRKSHIPAHREDTWKNVVQAQGYFLGNCAHCHNPSGYAYTDGNVKFDLRAGMATEFPTHLKPTKFKNDNLKLVSPVGNLDVSFLFRRVAGEPSELRGQDRMPLHTAGSPDCAAVNAVGRWILSYDSSKTSAEIDSYQLSKPCAQEFDFSRPVVEWFEEDPTTNEKDYVPRRADWKQLPGGMQDVYRSLEVSEALKELSLKEFPTGWWLNTNDKCSFPEVNETEERLAEYDESGMAWIRRGVESTRSPKTLGQLYQTSAGAHFFSQTCVKCHGRLGKGDGVIAKDFKQIAPANFVNGMFGQNGQNLGHFDDTDAQGNVKNLAAQYFVWMAMEGTRLKEIPPAAQDIVGKYGGRMLGQIRDNCFRLLTKEKLKARDGLLYSEVCTFNSLPLNSPQLALDENGEPINKQKVEEWLDHAAQSAGLLIYEYVRTQLANNKFMPSQGDCEMVDEFALP